MAHLIRNNFKQALTDFLIGYTQSSPSISLSELINSNTDNDEVKLKVSWLLRSISQNYWMKMKRTFMITLKVSVLSIATPRKGIFADEPKSGELRND